MSPELLFSLTLLLLSCMTETVKVHSKIASDLRHKCALSSDYTLLNVFRDKSKKTFVCCPKRGPAFETANEGKEKESGCCFPYGSVVDTSSQMPCCPITKRQEADGKTVCKMRDMISSVKFVASNTSACLPNATHAQLYPMHHEYKFATQDKQDKEYEIVTQLCCVIIGTDPKLDTPQEARARAAHVHLWGSDPITISDVYDGRKCCASGGAHLTFTMVGGRKVNGCRYDKRKG